MTRREMHAEIGRILRSGSWRAMSTTWQQGEVFAEEMRKAGFSIILRGVDTSTASTDSMAVTSNFEL